MGERTLSTGIVFSVHTERLKEKRTYNVEKPTNYTRNRRNYQLFPLESRFFICLFAFFVEPVSVILWVHEQQNLVYFKLLAVPTDVTT
jgi:hypothetical protein